MSVKIICNLDYYKPWEGAEDTLNKIKDAGKLEEFEQYLVEAYPDGITMGQLNDMLWFDDEFILDYLDIEPIGMEDAMEDEL